MLHPLEKGDPNAVRCRHCRGPRALVNTVLACIRCDWYRMWPVSRPTQQPPTTHDH